MKKTKGACLVIGNIVFNPEQSLKVSEMQESLLGMCVDLEKRLANERNKVLDEIIRVIGKDVNVKISVGNFSPAEIIELINNELRVLKSKG